MRKMAKIGVMVLVLFLVPSLCFAAGGWATCTVSRTGVGTDGNTYVRLTDTATPGSFVANTYFILSPTYSKQMLATLLTAMSLGKTVQVSLTAYTAYATVNACYLVD